MNCCSHCRDAGTFFDDKTARKELRRYNKKGPKKSTRLLLDQIRKRDVTGKTLLDIGGGIGSLTFELMRAGISRSVHVDASGAYLNAVKIEAQKRYLKDRIDFLYGDFTEMNDQIDNADIVTLDRVLCCYPDMEKLVDRSAEKSTRLYGVVFPRRFRYIGWGIGIGNLYFKLRGSDFRTFHHSPGAIDKRIRENGFRRIYHDHTIIWQIALYERQN
jgi:hypothetical protein